MLRALIRTGEGLLLSLIAYNLITALAGWRNQRPAAAGKRAQRFRVVVPAHNEERVIAGILDDLDRQEHPHREVWVLADRCTDRTVDIALARGARVAERSDGPDGKGAALAWYLDEHPLAEDEALVVLDADNRVTPNLLTRFADELDAGHKVLQAYLDVTNPDASSVALAAALSYWASNRMVDLARTNLGWTSNLSGTGMCIASDALLAAGGFGDSVTEDQDLLVRLLIAGYLVRWLHDIRVYDEKPASADVAMRQRLRWATGRADVAREWVRPLLVRGGPPAIDLAIRLRQPGRMVVAMMSGGLALAGMIGLPVSAPMWGAVTAVQVLAPIPFLARDGVEWRYIKRYPVLTVLPLLKLPARLVQQSGWYHTPHGEAPDET